MTRETVFRCMHALNKGRMTLAEIVDEVARQTGNKRDFRLEDRVVTELLIGAIDRSHDGVWSAVSRECGDESLPKLRRLEAAVIAFVNGWPAYHKQTAIMYARGMLGEDVAYLDIETAFHNVTTPVHRFMPDGEQTVVYNLREEYRLHRERHI